MKQCIDLVVLVIGALALAGCVSTATVDGAPSRAVDLLLLEERYEGEGEVLIGDYNAIRLYEAIQDEMENHDISVSMLSANPFIVTGTRKKVFTTEEKVSKGILVGLLSGDSSSAAEDRVEFSYSFVVVPVQHTGQTRYEFTGRAQKIVKLPNGRTVRGGSGAIKTESLLEIAERANALVYE